MSITTGFPVDANAARASGYRVTETDWNEVIGRLNSVPGWCLKANSGTSSAAGSTNVDTFAMNSKLGALDSLQVVVQCESVTQATAFPGLYHATDSVSMVYFIDFLTAGSKCIGDVLIGLYQPGTLVGATARMSTGVVNLDTIITTPYTGAWSLALRHAGVTSGGTFKWRWAIYLLKGQ